MKKLTKKLVLAKETLRSLQDDQLTAAIGGRPNLSATTCECRSNVQTCYAAGCANGPTRINC